MPNDDAIHFGRPPLSEVALSFQFEALSAFSYAEIGMLREHFRPAFPRIEYQAALPPSFETFGPPSVFPAPFSFPFSLPGGIPRIWLLDESGVEVLQFQPDRFTRNWRKTGEDSEYPHYDRIREAFLADLASLDRFLEDQGIGRIIPTQCEITYVNQILAPDGYSELVGRVFSNWNNPHASNFGELDNIAFNASFVLKRDDGTPVGRLYFQATSAFDIERRPILQFMVIGRGAPKARTIEAATDFLDFAHDRIVKGFIEMTTPEIQAEWGRTA
jgi:uncharacterized protein (TIGR04255 family)